MFAQNYFFLNPLRSNEKVSLFLHAAQKVGHIHGSERSEGYFKAAYRLPEGGLKIIKKLRRKEIERIRKCFREH